MKFIDLTGKKFGRLTVVERVAYVGRSKWRCLCDCGSYTEVLGNTLQVGDTKSCGCYRNMPSSRFQKVHRVHGVSNSKLYNVWWSMRDRCKNPTSKYWKYYGGRGISICKEWEDPRLFVEWAVSSGWKEGLQIDRRDNDGNYETENCRWVTSEININNRRIKRNNISGYQGVRPDKLLKKWVARISSIRMKGKEMHLGTFSTAWAAVTARNNFIIKHGLPHRIQEQINEE